MDVKETSAGKSEQPDPEPNTPPEAKGNSGSESGRSETGPRRRFHQGIEGAKRLICRRCGHFLMEVKAPEFEIITICHRCRTENSFAFQTI